MSTNLVVFFAMTAFVAFIVGLAKGGLGGTIGALATPLMALVMPANEVIGLLLPILMLADLFAVALHWKRWSWRHVLLLLPGAIVGITIGTFFIRSAPTEMLQLALAIIVLIFGVYKFFEERILAGIHYVARAWHGLAAGTIAGFSSALAHNGGPAVTIYLLMQKEVTPAIFIASSALFFFIVNWIKVPYYFYADLFDFQALTRILWLIPLVPLGVWVGKWWGTRVDKKTFDRVITALLVITGILLLVI